MRKMPALRDVRNIVKNAQTESTQLSTGEWAPVRPCAFCPGVSLFVRLKYAWLVFTGKADALVWPEQ